MVDYSAAAAAVVVDMSLFGPERVVPDFYTGTATGGSGNDYLVNVENATGSAFDDIFLGDFGSNVLLGNGGDDRLTGGFGADRLDGGTGRDTADYAQARGGVTINLITGTGNRGEATGDVLIGIENVTGGLGGDRITGDAQGNVLDGGAGGSDNLNGMEGDDFLFGHARTDRLAGGLGDDRLDGGAGADALLGGLGNDHFIFTEMRDSTPGERDVIVDFGQALGDCDRIDLRVLDAVPVTELQNEAFVLTGHHGGARFTHMAGELRLVLTAGGTEVRLDINGDGDSDMEILVKGVQDLTGHDFLL